MSRKPVTNAYDLFLLLDSKFGKRFYGDILESMSGAFNASLDGKSFHLTYSQNEYLLITMEPGGSKVLEELTPTLKEAMDGNDQICSYDLHYENLVPGAWETLEWDVLDPENRIKEIVNGRSFPNKTDLRNLKLFGSRKIEDYLETKEEKTERIKKARIYGIDPGSISDTEKVNNYQEFELYLAIDALGGHIWWCEHQMAHGRIDPVDLTEEKYGLAYLVNQTRKFGVELAEPEADKLLLPTTSYYAWFRFYDHHFKEILTREEQSKFQRLYSAGEDVSTYLPKESWQIYLKGSQDTLKKEKVPQN